MLARHWLIIGLIVVMAATGIARAQGQRPALSFESLRDGSFGPSAVQYVAQHEHTLEAASVLLEMYAAAVVTDDARAQRDVRMLLLSRYGKTPHALYIAHTFEDGKAARAFVSQRLGELETAADMVEAEPVLLATLPLFQVHKDLFADSTFALKVAALADAVDSASLRKSLLEQVPAETRTGEHEQRVELLFGDRSKVDRFIALHQRDDMPERWFFEQALLAQMSERQLAHGPVLRIRAELELAAARFEQALPLIDKLDPGDDADQLLFWEGWALLNTGRTVEAVKVLRTLQADHADSPWAKLAARAIAGADFRQAFVARAAAALDRVLQRIKAGVDVVEVHLVSKPGDGTPPLQAFVRLGISDNHMRVSLARGDRMLLGYDAGDQQTRIYLDGESHILVFDDMVVWPAPQLELGEKGDGTITTQLSMSMVVNQPMVEVAAAGRGLLASPLLATEDGRRRLVRRLLHRGELPGKVSADETGTTLTWCGVDPTDPEPKRRQVHVSADGVLDRITFADYTVRLHYGQASVMDVEAIAWPDVPEQREDTPMALMALAAKAGARLAEAFKDGAPPPVDADR